MGPPKMAIIAPPTREFRAAAAATTTALLGPTLAAALRCQRLLGVASLFLCAQVCWLAWQAALTSWSVAVHACAAAVRAAVLAKAVWRSKPVMALRRKVVFEFVALLLGSGNALFLVLFWPGWWVLGLIALATRLSVG
ncbi:hypothetical protein GGS23DRAFT_138470 [Durotheca rogersii]|uniref:uncharacterized protein n=1 Tax=Durotheca rogersii TaxID=419775 RepID=UPI0022205602|nr:uncharacterized protein GGS23DRAFT_138470 [Durotheca rogersii]KAI5861546.1 hypothetical protein GGS23DRAFT_138470 [Durotheca rogersii]